MRLVLRQARVLDPASGFDGLSDIVIEDGRIARVGPDAATQMEGHIEGDWDLQGKWVTPGFVDLHTHLREPGHEYKEDIASGLAAAAAGGFTAVCAMANTLPVNDTRAVTESLIAKARAQEGPRLYPIGAITKGLLGEQLTEMSDLKDAGAIGVSDDGRCVMNAGIMRRAMEYASTFDLLVTQHAEDHHMTAGAEMHEGEISTRLGLNGWPRVAEDIIVARDLLLAELTGARYHVAHVSSMGSVRLLREAKSRGLSVSAEVTPHHLLLTEQNVLGYNTACKVNPPLRTEEDREALREALADGTLDCIATDHAPHSSVEKLCEFSAASPGLIGLETAVSALLQLVRHNQLSALRLVEALSTAPARLGKLAGGSLKEGLPADITVIDPEMRWTVTPNQLRSKSENTPWLHTEMQGAVIMTLVNGKTVYQR
ncbi:MAG: dihydroorotase [Myxococcales bacterium]|nr:dihydroorotase [Myxococcales bacterium]